MLKFKNFLKESNESGNIKLQIDDKTSHWFYIDDTIVNGILEDYLGLSDVDDIIEEYFDSLNDDDYVGCTTLGELSDYFLDDFEEHMDHFLSYLIGHDFIEFKPEIEIHGKDDDDESWNFTYYPDMYN